jgi:putative transcriptional regulator
LQVTRSDGSQEIVKPKRLRDLSEEEVHAAALSDPDAQPLTEQQLARLRPMAHVKRLRFALGLTQDEFASRYRIPLGTLRDWEQGRCEPDQAAKAYLAVIAKEPERVRKVLEAEPV